MMIQERLWDEMETPEQSWNLPQGVTSCRPTLHVADASDMEWCQTQVELHHYLQSRVPSISFPFAYIVLLHGRRIGCVIFSRPQNTTTDGWFGTVENLAAGRVRFSYWQMLNLSRFYLVSAVQNEEEWRRAGIVPGFLDREQVWHSQLATTVLDMALDCIAVDYLLCYQPCFLDQPYELAEVLSYCDTRVHRGTIYQQFSFRLERKNARGIWTYARPLRRLSPGEDASICALAERSERARRMRSDRAAQDYQQQQLHLLSLVQANARPGHRSGHLHTKKKGRETP